MATKAFLVGIDDYAPLGASESDLSGCVNDARDMENTLVICGFDPGSIRLCTDTCATKKGILAGLEWLIKGAKKDDSLVFFYAGHGSQVADTSKDEVDRKDEILCPHDIDFSRRVFISDDDLQPILSSLSPADVNLEVILDSCHSGTGTREFLALTGLPEPHKVGFRYLAPPIDFTFHIDDQPDLPTRKLFRLNIAKQDAVVVPGLNHTLWAGCRDNQTTEETDIEGVVRGAFTYHFCQVLRRTSGNITRRELDSLVTAAIKRAGFAQIPQLQTSAPEMIDKLFR